MKIIFIILLGLLVGSFLNICIYRIYIKESISSPHLYCITCERHPKSKGYMNVIRYIFLYRICRYCKQKIIIRYELVKILNVISYLIIFLNYGLSFEFYKFSVFASLMIVIGFIDFEIKYVLNSTVVFGVITGVIFLIFEYIIIKSIPWTNILGAIIGFLIIWLIVISTSGMGEGDIDIAFICGLFTGTKGIIITLFLAFIIGGIVASIILILKIKNRKSEIAFGPYLAIGSILAVVSGNELISYYFSLF